MPNRVVTVNVPKIKQLANEKNLSLTSLEEELKIANGTIGKWKNSGARVDTLYRVADYLGTSMIELLERV